MLKIIMILLCVLLSSICYANNVEVTAYTLYKNGSTKTASGIDLTKEKNRNFIALSRDLGKKYNFGDKFLLEIDDQIFIVEYQDRMKKGLKKTIDFYMIDKKMCMEFGRKKGKLIPLKD